MKSRLLLLLLALVLLPFYTTASSISALFHHSCLTPTPLDDTWYNYYLKNALTPLQNQFDAWSKVNIDKLLDHLRYRRQPLLSVPWMKSALLGDPYLPDALRSLLESDSIANWQLCSILLQQILLTRQPTTIAIDLIALLLQRTHLHVQFYPMLLELLRLLPDSSLPHIPLEKPFFVDILKPSVQFANDDDHDSDQPIPGSRPDLEGILAVELFGEWLRCSPDVTVLGGVRTAAHCLRPLLWSIICHDGVARIVKYIDLSYTTVSNHLELDPSYGLHLYAEAFLRSSGSDIDQMITRLHAFDMSRTADPDIVKSVLVKAFFNTYDVRDNPDRQSQWPNPIPLNRTVLRLLSHFHLDDLVKVFVSVRDLDHRLGVGRRLAMFSTHAGPEATHLSSYRVKQITFGTSVWGRFAWNPTCLELFGKIHYALLCRPELHRLYRQRLQTPYQCFVVVLSLAYWHSSDKHNDSDSPGGAIIDILFKQLIVDIHKRQHAHFAPYLDGHFQVVLELIARSWTLLELDSSATWEALFRTEPTYVRRAPHLLPYLIGALTTDTDDRPQKAFHLLSNLGMSLTQDPDLYQGHDLIPLLEPIFNDLKDWDQIRLLHQKGAPLYRMERIL